jgi:LemA protein
MMLLLIVLLAVLAVIVLVIVYYINKIIILSNRIGNAFSQIDVQLKKRVDLVPNLVNTVKGYAKHEKSIFEKVTNARKEMLSAKDMKGKLKASDKMTTALKSIFAIAENYPDLKASENFKLLQEQLEGIENKIAYSRQFYNDSVLDFNNTITTIPGSWFASMLGRNKMKEYFEIEEKERKPVKVEF